MEFCKICSKVHTNLPRKIYVLHIHFGPSSGTSNSRLQTNAFSFPQSHSTRLKPWPGGGGVVESYDNLWRNWWTIIASNRNITRRPSIHDFSGFRTRDRDRARRTSWILFSPGVIFEINSSITLYGNMCKIY